MAHGYLLSEFLDPYYNKRIDEYGGSNKNRYHIIHEILTRACRIKNPNFAIIAKIDTVSKIEDDGFLNQQLEVCKCMELDGIDAIEISGANFKKCNQSTPYYLENALKIKKNVDVPIILVGGFRNINQMEDALDKGIDFISMCRPFIADEDFIQRLKNGEESRCTNCNQCFEVFKTQYKRCILRNDTIPQLEINYS
jgi:2,4-dienoyl-CoA reductase-like NADH-dependent reductase (Old Yellow Enzyme family)